MHKMGTWSNVGLMKIAQTDPFCFIFVKSVILMTAWIKILLRVVGLRPIVPELFLVIGQKPKD